MVDERRDDAEAGTRIVVPLDIIPRVDIARSRGARTRARARRCAYIVRATGARHRRRCARDGVCGSASASRLGMFVNVSEPSIVIFTVGGFVLGTILRPSILYMCLKRHTIGKTNATRARPRANRSRRRRAVSRANRAHRASPRVTVSRARRRVASWTPEGATRSNAPKSPVSERARDATTRRARTRCHRRPRSGRRLHRVPVVAPRVRTPATRERRRRKRRRR